MIRTQASQEVERRIFVAPLHFNVIFGKENVEFHSALARLAPMGDLFEKTPSHFQILKNPNLVRILHRAHLGRNLDNTSQTLPFVEQID